MPWPEPSPALDFLEQFYAETGCQEPALAQRLAEVGQEWASTGRWTPTTAELTFGAQVAWRNSTRCIGRLFWPALQVRDLRHVTQPDEVFKHLLSHLHDAFCGGRIQPIISVFGEGIRILNPQLIRYAGYRQQSGVVGDPENVTLTEYLQGLGWTGAGTPFDVLPLVIRDLAGAVQVYPLPAEAVQEVQISHPHYPEVMSLGLKWHALPVISDATLEIGGLNFGCAPFNGWYMQTEIAARDLADEHRYNALPKVAQALGLDMSHPRTLWRDRALLELNVAVLHSFREAGVKIVDHHSAAEQFVRFQEREARAGREVRGRWSWLISPMSPATSPLWAQGFKAQELSPHFVRPPAGCPVGHP